MSRSAAGPRRLVPETVQTSGMDCGPAALRSLLAGFGLEVSYGRLREACQTDVDGTSINALEESARALGMDVAQLMLPADHVAIPCATALPAIAVAQAAQRHAALRRRVAPPRALGAAHGPRHRAAARRRARACRTSSTSTSSPCRWPPGRALRGRADVSGRAARAAAGARRCASATRGALDRPRRRRRGRPRWRRSTRRRACSPAPTPTATGATPARSALAAAIDDPAAALATLPAEAWFARPLDGGERGPAARRRARARARPRGRAARSRHAAARISPRR